MWTKSNMQDLLNRNPKAVMRAIVLLYQAQTEDEKSGQYTHHENGVGFSKFDAKFMSSLANQIIAGRGLSAKQIAVGTNKVKRYWRQLCEVANAKEASTAGQVVMQSAADPEVVVGDWGNYAEAKLAEAQAEHEANLCHCNAEQFDGEPHFKHEHFRFRNLHLVGGL